MRYLYGLEKGNGVPIIRHATEALISGAHMRRGVRSTGASLPVTWTRLSRVFKRLSGRNNKSVVSESYIMTCGPYHAQP